MSKNSDNEQALLSLVFDNLELQKSRKQLQLSETLPSAI